MVELDRGALQLADHAFIEVDGTAAQRVHAAIYAYLWALENVHRGPDEDYPVFTHYPSLNMLRAELARVMPLSTRDDVTSAT